MDGGARIIGLIVMTFMVAIFYGLFLTTMDFMAPNYNPITSGHRAADNIYGLFGTVATEIKNNDGSASDHGTSVTHKIAMPYAVTADLSAILGGKLEVKVSSLFHMSQNHS